MYKIFEGELLVVPWLTLLHQIFFLTLLLPERFYQNCQTVFLGAVSVHGSITYLSAR